MGVRERFVRDILEDEGLRMLRNQGFAIRAETKERTGDLMDRRAIAVRGGDDLDGKLVLEHTVYERFLDMRRDRKSRRRRRRKIHNRFVFGAYASVARRLMYDLSDEMAKAMKEEFEGTK